MAASFKLTQLLFILAFISATLICIAHADCPDAGIRCRIPQKNYGSTVTVNGCQVSGGASATITGEVPSGTASVNGNCYNQVTTTDKASYVPVGSITIGQCYDLFQGGCQPAHCSGNDPTKRCIEKLADCTVYRQQSTQCTQTYSVKQGDYCQLIADNNKMTLQALLNLNPGLVCKNLQPNQKVCLKKELVKGPGTPVCEGYKFSG